MTDYDDATSLRKEVARCHRLAAGVSDALTSERLGTLAKEYEKRADLLSARMRIKPIV